MMMAFGVGVRAGADGYHWSNSGQLPRQMTHLAEAWCFNSASRGS